MASRPSTTVWERLSDFVTLHSRPIVVLVLVGTLLLSVCLVRINVSSETIDFNRKDSRQVIDMLLHDFNEGFYFYIIAEAQGDRSLLEPEMLKQQFKVMEEIKKHFKVRTFSLVEGLNEGLRKNKNKSVLDIADDNEVGEAILAVSGGKTVMDLEKVSSHLLSNPEAIDFYVKFRMSAAMLGAGSAGPGKLSFSIPSVKAIQAFGQLDASYPLEKQRFVFADIRKLAQSYSTPEIAFHTFAGDLASYDVDAQAKSNVFLMALILFLVDIFFLWGEFRSGREIFLVLFILCTSCIWTFGIAALLGIRIIFLHLIVIPILLGVGIDNSFVFGRRLCEERETGKGFTEAIRASFEGTGLGIVLATVTTLIAFLSSAFTSGGARAIVSFNLLVALSMAVCLALTLVLQGALRVEEEKWRGRRVAEPHASSRALQEVRRALKLPALLERWRSIAGSERVRGAVEKTYVHLNRITAGCAQLGSRCVARRPRLVLLVSAAVVIAALVSASRISTEFDYRMLMRKSMPTYKVDRLQEKYFGRSKVGYLLLEGDVANPVLLEKLRLLQKRMGGYPDVEKILGVANVDSINDLIDKMQSSLPPNASTQEVFDVVSASDKTANYILNESFKDAASHLLRKRGGQYDGLVLKFYLTSSDAQKTQAFSDRLKADMKELRFDEIAGVRARIGGGIVGFHLEEQYYIGNLVSSFFVTLAMNFVVLLLVWRRFWQSLIAMIPTLISVILTLGLMPIFGIKLNILNLCIGSVIVGLGDDYPIHITERFVEERKKGLTRLEAAQAALDSLGSNIMACAMTSVIGFGAACIIAIPVAESFGVLIAMSLLIVFLASIFILPVLLVGRRVARPPSVAARE